MMVWSLGPAFDRLFTAANDNLTGVSLGRSKTVVLYFADEAIMVLAIVWRCSL